MKTFITLLFLVLSVSLFAQPQKGDFYIGDSNFNFNSIQNTSNGFGGFGDFRQNSLFASPTFGKFITNNTLVGGGVSYLSNFSFFSPTSSFLNVNLFCTQYLGKGKLKGLGKISFNSFLTRNTNSRGIFANDIALGGAYFVNDFTSVELLYNVNFFTTVEGSKTEYFPLGIAPNIGLTLRTFLLRNREGVENLSALNSIKKGTTAIGLSSGLTDNSDQTSRTFDGAFNYFFLDNLYFDAKTSVFYNNIKSIDNLDFTRFDFSLNVGYYLKIEDSLYVRLSMGASYGGQSTDIVGIDGMDNFRTYITDLRWNSELGGAMFFGRHKLEPGFGLRVSNTRLKELDFKSTVDLSPNLFLNYEWFLAQNFAFLASATYRFNDVDYFPTAGIDFETGTIFRDIVGFAQSSGNIGVGFKWYLSTPVE